jgi:hypothetical protein
MWRRVNNIIQSISFYADFSPDLKTRQLVNQTLRDRRALSLDEWFDRFWQPRGISKTIAGFVYTHLEKYSGLQAAKFRPGDRLEQDLKLTMVCWFDWHLTLCEDFCLCFGIDISDRFDLRDFYTLEEFMSFLDRQLLPVTSL